LLIKNKKGEYWIPKGHIEAGEDQVTAAFREIQEEVGLTRSQLTHIGLCHLYEFSFIDENGQPNTKEVYMNVFVTNERYPLSIEQGDETDIREVEWFEYSRALDAILHFSKNELIKARGMLGNCVKLPD
jgi:ADP-ribose pyrophosphatase YjhB (NUDIX family)